MVPAAKIADSGIPACAIIRISLKVSYPGWLPYVGAEGVSLPNNSGWPSSQAQAQDADVPRRAANGNEAERFAAAMSPTHPRLALVWTAWSGREE